MSNNGKTLVIILAVTIGLAVTELIREKIIYLRYYRNLKVVCEKAERGLTKDNVKSLAGKPDDVTKNASGEIWRWNAMQHQGAMWNLLGLAWVKGHYDVSIAFDGDEKVAHKWCGTN